MLKSALDVMGERNVKIQSHKAFVLSDDYEGSVADALIFSLLGDLFKGLPSHL